MTPDSGTPRRVRITRCGKTARDLFATGRDGRVMAVFKNSFYLASGDRLACIGNPSLGLGPLNAICAGTDDIDWSANAFRPGTAYRVAADRISINGRFVFSFGDAATWMPRPNACLVTAGALQRGLQHLYWLAAGRVPTTGLGRVVFGDPESDATMAAPRESMVALRRWLTCTLQDRESASPQDLRTARRLLGLGPGLTPSGDDLLGGVMIALHALGRREAAGDFWSIIRPMAADSVNPISRAHLEAAAHGLGSEAVHSLLAALPTRSPCAIAAALDDIDRIGHTSGWDALAGVVVALQALSDSARTDGAVVRAAVAV